MNKTTSPIAAGLLILGLAACDTGPQTDGAVTETSDAESSSSAEEGAEKARAAQPADAGAAAPVDSAAADAARESLLEILRIEDFSERTQKLASLLPTLGPEVVPSLPEIMNDPMLPLAATDHLLLVRFWAAHKAPRAAQWALTEAPPFSRIATVVAAFEVWAAADPHAAMAASQKRISQIGEARDAVQAGLVRGWYRTNPEELSQFIQELGMGLSRQRALSVYMHEVLRTQGPEALMEWAEARQGDATYKTSVYRQVGAALPLYDLPASIRWCDAHCDGPYGKNLRSIIARRWVLTDGASALAWVGEKMPEGHDKDLAVRHTYATWGQVDHKAAVAWMTEQATGELADWLRPAIPVYARLLAENSPADAIVWAEQVEADDEREILLVGLARLWRQTDEAAAEAWLQNSPLSEQAREKVRTPVERAAPAS